MMNYQFPHRIMYLDDLANWEAVDLLLKGISVFFRLANITCLVIDIDTRRVLYQSDKMIYLKDVPLPIHQKDWGSLYLNSVANDTLNLLLQIRNESLHVAQTMDDNDFNTYICSIDYPILIKGKEFFIHQEFIPLVVHTDRKPKIGLSIIGPSTCKTIESYLFVESKIKYRFDFRTGKYRKFNLDFSLSTMEENILRFAQKGFTIKKIADNLNTSMSTIKTHRMRLFKKLQVLTMSEALTATRNYHLI